MTTRKKDQSSNFAVQTASDPAHRRGSLPLIVNTPRVVRAPSSKITHVAGPESTHSKVDILFIHGLGEDWEQTWDGIDEPETWLRALLPKDVPAATIMTYGYDVLEWIEPDLEPIKESARRLITDLQKMRKEFERPIVFVAHSLGGIILREALVYTSKVQFEYDIQGLVFISTPNFSNVEDWVDFGHRLNRTITGSRNTSFFSAEQAAIPDRKSFETMASMSNINQRFEEWLQKSTVHSVYCFHEAVPMYRIGVVVRRESASIAGITPIALHADHTSITKFDNSMDQSYRTISKVLRLLSNPSTDMSASTRALAQNAKIPRHAKADSINGLPTALDGREVLLETKWDVPRRAGKQCNLALALEDLGRFKEAEIYYRQALEEFHEEPAPEDPVYLFCLHKLSAVLRDRSKYPEAESLATEAWQARLKANGVDHPTTLLSAGNLARILRFRGKYKEAYATLANALGPFEACPYDSISGTNAVGILSKILKELGLYKTSELLIRNVIGACVHHLGQRHAYTFNRQADLAVVLTKQHKFDAAYRVGSMALNGLEQVLGTDHPHTLRAAKRVANILRFQGKLDKAKALLQQTVDTQNPLFEASENDVLSTTCSLAAVNALLGNFKEAKESLKQVAEYRKRLFGVDHIDTDWTYRALYAIQRLMQFEATPEDMNKEIKSQLALGIAGEANKLTSEDSHITSSNPTTGDETENSPKELSDENSGSSVEFKSIVTFFLSPTKPKKYSGENEWKTFDELFINVGRYGKDKFVITVEEARQLQPDSNSLAQHLEAAAANDDGEVVKLLLLKVEDPTQLINGHVNVLQGAAYGQKPSIMQSLLDWFKSRNVDLHRRPEILGRTLRVAAILGKTDLVQKILSCGAEINSKGAYFGSALQAACYGGHFGTVSYLIKQTANVDQKAGLFISPLGAAAYKGHAKIVRLLLDNKAALKAHGAGIGSALQTALVKADLETLDTLFENRDKVHEEQVHIAVNWQDASFGTPLQEASWAGDEHLVSLLIDNGADLSIHSGVIESPLEMAAAAGHVRIVDRLLTARPNDELVGFDGALRAAAVAGRDKVLDRLLDDERREEFKGLSTALQAASVADQPEMTRKIYSRAKATLESKGVSGSIEQVVLTYTIDDDYTID